jgi:hypothetical protein
MIESRKVRWAGHIARMRDIGRKSRRKEATRRNKT